MDEAHQLQVEVNGGDVYSTFKQVFREGCMAITLENIASELMGDVVRARFDNISINM